MSERRDIFVGNRRAGILTQNPSSVAIFNSITLAKFWVFWGWNPVSDSGCHFFKCPAIFFAPIRFFKSESVYALTAKTRWHKAFYKTYCRVFETHSDRKVRPFLPDFCPSRFWILRNPASREKLETLHNILIINNNAFLNRHELVGRKKRGRVGYKLTWKRVRPGHRFSLNVVYPHF